MPTHYGPQQGNQEGEDYGFRSVEEPWNPSYTQEQVEEYIDAYKANPRQFDPDFLRTVNQHAAHYKMPFAYNEADNQASVGSLVSNIGSGFVEGFTTLRIDKDQPTNEWDAIAKNIGHLAGFVGFLPLSTPLRFLKFKKLAGAVRALKGKSVPMLVAGAATKKAKKVARSMTSGARDARVAAGKDALSVFDRHPMMKDIVEGSFHLGVASSVSSWQGGIDEMMHGFIGGAQTGAAFRGIGNLVKGFGPQGDKAVRGLVSSLYTGLPSTMQGQTTPEQVYQYLLGAYFGVNEMPYHRRQGEQFHNKWAWGDKKKPEGWIGEPFESVPGWEKLDEVTKRYVEDVAHPKWKETNSEYAAAVLMEKAGMVGEGGKPFFSEEEAELRQILKEELQEKEYTDVEVFNESEISRVKTAMEEGTLEKIGDDITSEQLETPIQAKIQQFVDKEMENIWMETEKPAEQKLVMYVQIQKKWNELIEKAQKDRVNPDQEMRTWLAEIYGIDANRESIQNEWRAFGNRILKARPVAMITTKVNPDGTVTVSKLPFGATNDAGKQKILQTEPHLIQEIYEEIHRELYPDQPIKSKFGPEKEPAVVGVNIYSRSDDPLGRALTNPVWGSAKDGKNYFNVEAAYKKQKTGDLVKDKELMRDLIIQKFQQNPELIDQIAERGGVAFLEASSHSVSPKYDKTSRWTGEGKESEFINTLIDAYKEVAKPVTEPLVRQPTTFVDAEGREFTPLAWFNSKTGKITLDTDRIAADYDAGFPYLQGKQGPTSEQKKLVLERMEIKLDNLKKFLELRGGKYAYEDFILFHEEGHKELGHSGSKDLFSEETLRIEQQATQYAIDIMKSKPYYDSSQPEFNKMPRPRITPSMRYAGIGARKTPDNFQTQMTDIASKLEFEGYILRSGGAEGADKAFEKGTTRSEIFYKEDAIDQTRAIAKEIHPAPDKLHGYGLDLQARNTNQLFGKNLDTPVDFILAWTPGGAQVGGTAQAMRMAALKGIPIINMAKPGWRAELQKVVEKNKRAEFDAAPDIEPTPPPVGASVDVEMILDHTVVSTSVENPITKRTKMVSQELRLSELPEFYRNRIQNDPNFKGRTSEEIDSLVQNAVDEHHGQVFYNMSKKGYYYYSGRGDAHRQIFVKYHPLLKGVSSDSIQKHLDNLFKIMPKEYKEDYRKDERAYWYTYQRVMGENVEGTWIPKTDQLFAKEWLSNLLYLHSLGIGKPAKNIGESIEAFKKMHNKKDKDGNVINSYIKSPKDFNKRVQIWFTSGISMDVDYIKKMKAEDGKLQIRDFNEDGTFNIMLTAGPERFNQRDLKNDALAELYNEIEDGAIIVRSDVLKAILRQAGLPSDSGFEKSFIAAPDPVYGALTGKYAMYPTRTKMDAWMKRNNVHFIVNALSVKQKGERDYVTYDWDARKQTVNVKKYNEISKIEGEPVTDISKILYKLDPKYFRTITGDYASKKNLEDVQVHKQVFTNLTPYAYSPIDQREIQDMYNGLVNKRIKGDADVNKDLEKFLSDPAGQQAMVKPLVKNLKKLGINELLRAMRSNNPHVQKFTAKIYNAMFRIEPSTRDALRAEGEASVADTHLENLLSLENKGVYERIMRITDDDLSGVLHKWSTRIRGSVVRNFFVDQVTRPLATNSVSARMRPYDPAMRQEDGVEGKTTELNKRDDIFFLDDLHKNKWFKIAGDKPMQLKDLWKGVDAANKGRPIKGFPTEKAREILRALVVRTPMDSISGGHVLEFAGFTGVDGYGVLLHPRALKALGGADLDGDKAQVYFGDEAHGMKKSWKDMYHKNKNEYLNQVTKQIETNKPADLEARFGTDNTELTDRLKNPNLILSPLARRNASEGAAYGRDLLGPVVVNRATTSATHAAIASLPDRKEAIKVVEHDPNDPKKKITYDLEVDVPAGHYLFEVKKRTGFTYEGEPEYRRQWLIIEAKTDAASLHEFRRVARALIGFTSDPMDIAGMQSRESVVNAMKSTILKLNIAKIGQNGKITKGAGDPHPDFDGIQSTDMYMPTRLFGNVNSTLYGKFKEQNRRYYAYEIQKAQAELYSPHRKRYDTDLKDFLHQPGFVGAERNSYLALIANDMKDIDFSESIFRRLKREEGENGLEEAVKKLYNDHNDLVKPGQKFDWLRDKLDRGSLWVPDGEVINKVITNHLFEKYGYERQLDPKRWDIDLMDHYYGKSPEYMEDKKIPVKRALWLNDYIKAAEDLFVNDLSDITSIKLLDHWARKVKDKRVINSIWKKTERFKLQAAINDGKEPLRGQIGYKDTLFEQQQNLSDSKETSKIIPRVELDREMQDYRDGLKSNEQKKLFDHFMLGTLNRKESKQQSMLQAAAGTINPEEVMSSKDKIDTGHKTSLAKIGFASSAVSDNSIKEYFKEYSKVFDKVDDTLTPKEVEGAKEYAENLEEPRLIPTADGLTVSGSHLNTNSKSAESDKYIDEIAPFEGLKTGKVSKEEGKVINSIIDHIEHYFGDQPIYGKYFNQIVRGVLHKDVNAMTSRDIRVLDNYFKNIRNKGFINTVLDFFSKSKANQLPKRIYYNFPEANNKLLMSHDIAFIEKKALFKNKRGDPIMGNIRQPTQIVNELRDLHGNAQTLILKQQDEYRVEMQDEFAEIFVLEDGYKIYEMAGRMMESFGEIRLEDNLSDVPISGVVKDYLEKRIEMGKAPTSAETSFLYEVYQEALNRAVVNSDWHIVKNKDYVIGGRKVKGSQLATEILRKLTKENSKLHTWHIGDGKTAKKYLDDIMAELEKVDFIDLELSHFTKGGERIYRDIGNLSDTKLSEIVDNNLGALRSMRKKFLKDAKDNKIPLELGMDNLNRIVRYMQLHEMHGAYTSEAGRQGKINFLGSLKSVKEDITDTGKYSFNNYFPHISYERKLAAQGLLKYIEHLSVDPDLLKHTKERQRLIQAAILRHRQLEGDFVKGTQLQESWKDVAEVLHGLANDKRDVMVNGFKRFNKNRKVSSQFSRIAHAEGWIVSPDAYERYVKNVINTFHQQIADVSGRDAIYQFKNHKNSANKRLGRELTDLWSEFLYLYHEQAGGNPTNIPKYVLDNPQMNIKGTAYAWFADNMVARRLNKAREMLGLRKGVQKLAGIPITGSLTDEDLKTLKDVDFNTLKKLGQMEAKYQLATVLAHPKSTVANLYGGSVHTLISTGWEHYKNAKSIKYLRLHVNKNWKSMEDVNDWVKSLGIIEEFLIFEADMNPNIKSANMQKAVREAIGAIKKDPNLPDRNLYRIAQKHGITESAFNKAASFMRVPERFLRRDAFMAHYLQAREKFGNLTPEFDNQTLVEMAKKGVKATQFLYSAPYRPAFANSQLGKVMTRFQIWAWNSVRFRRQIVEQAHIYGWKEGTQQFEAFKRLAIADMFMLGLSNIFMYSIFENALPAPWNWFQDTADLMFGDDKERERAFFGAYPYPLQPLQIITPPALRLLPPMFKAMVTDDYSRLADYYIWTMFPFGRLMRDVVGPGGIIENPMRTVEKTTGIPYMQFGKYFKAMQEQERLKPGG